MTSGQILKVVKVTMSSDTTGSTNPATPESEEQQNVVSRVASLPLVSSAYNMVSSAYTSTKENHPYIKSVCDVAEMGVKTITAAAVSGAQPILNKLEPQISTANEYACKGLDKLEEKLPFLQQPTEKVVSETKELVSGAKDAVSSTVTGAKDAVSNRVTGVVDMAKGAVQGSVEMTKAAVTSSVNTVMGSKVGQLVSSSVGTMLGKSEEWVDHYLPMTDEELALLASSVEGFEGASLQQQKSEQSYFVRLGSLSTKVRNRAYQHSLGKVRHARQSTQEALSQLHQTIDLIDMAKQSIHDGQEKLNQLWLDWNKKQAAGTSADRPAEPEHIESRALAMTRSLTQQLQTTCQTLVSSMQGLPSNIQEKVQQLRQNTEELHYSFSTAHSFQDLSSSVLAQSREQVNKAWEHMDELVNYLVTNTPLTWLVGPFAPQLVEHPEEQEMEEIQ
ncbi:perilipin-3-like isoform X2 [Rhinatrema bivittatum]|uniref:perilipin-3-like isoform X2 n=1 Tax=Rhinatrema bivittatum TaxID=194408 RepID=UPI0011289D32|nr:perilipin-3-like isoform X2 [Rhinatrema bivittatum]